MSRMKHLLRKLHIGVGSGGGGGAGLNDPPHHRLPETTRPLVSPNSNPSSTSPPSSSSATNGAVTPAESAAADQMTADFFEEEYQVQLALAISASDQPDARVDPESAQIDAAKRISLGCTATAADSQALVEFLSLRYWTYNVVNYDEKVLDGFYDVYGITPSSVVPGKMPLLVDLQAISISDNVDYEVISVNRLVDPDLQQLEQKAAALYIECGAFELGPILSGLIQKIADIVVCRMGGPVGDADEMLRRWQLRSYELRNTLNTIVLPLGYLDVGLSRHRALLFKVLADKINLPCMLIKGSYYTGTDDGAVNLIKFENGSEYIIDLMGAPGTLIPAEVPSSHLSSTGLVARSITDVKDTPECPHLGLEKGTVTLADLCRKDMVCREESSILDETSHVSTRRKGHERKSAENHQTEKFEYDFGQLRPKLGKSCEDSADSFARSSDAEKSQVNNVSKYVISASKDPEFAQKLHAVLLDSEASGSLSTLDAVREIVSEQLGIPAQQCPEQPFLTAFSQLGDNVSYNNEKQNIVERTAKNQDQSEKDIENCSLPSAVASEGILLISGGSNQTVKPNARDSDLVPFCRPESSPFASDSCLRQLDNFIVCDSKQQFQDTVQDKNVGLCKKSSVEEIEKFDNASTQRRERIDQVLSEVSEWEIPWEHIQIGERIGIGSYGEVYRADWNGTEVAVKKFLDQDLSGDALNQFRFEIEIMLRLRHPNVVLFMGAVTRPPHLSILTEFLPRGSLYKLLHRPNQHLDERRRLKMALDVAKGMNYLHSSHPPIVHRDLKTPNLLVDKNWVVKVCDFGLSRMKHNTFLSSKSTAGTPEWMAPEVLRNEPANEKCDVYSFGVILWELTTMCIPWKGLNPMQVVGAVGFQNRRLEIPENVDPAVAQIINDCWQTEPHLRPSFSQLMSRLRRVHCLFVNKSLSKSSKLIAAPTSVQ